MSKAVGSRKVNGIRRSFMIMMCSNVTPNIMIQSSSPQPTILFLRGYRVTRYHDVTMSRCQRLVMAMLTI